MSEFVYDQDEMFRSLGEVYDDLRDRASELIGRISTRMGFGEPGIAYSTESNEPASDDNATAEMADEEEKKEEPEVIVTDEQRTGRDGEQVVVHTESLSPGSAGSGTGEGQPVNPNSK